MTSLATNIPLTVSTDGTAGPYLIVTPEQHNTVAEALQADGVPFHAEEDIVRLNGEPALVVIELGPDADVDRVQRVLDRVSASQEGKGKQRIRSATREKLLVRGDSTALHELRRRLEAASFGDWVRRPEVEERLRKTLARRTNAYCFSKTMPSLRREVAVLMQGRGPGDDQELYVSGVVPLEGRAAISVDQQDQVISDYRTTLLDPLVVGLNIRILGYRVHVEPTLEELASPEALGRLQAFLAVTNKSNLQPVDLRRWAGFIAQTHLDDTVIDLGLLACWLEESGFPTQQRDRLVYEYESGRRLLSAYDEERGS